jgi:hypothetical protein
MPAFHTKYIFTRKPSIYFSGHCAAYPNCPGRFWLATFQLCPRRLSRGQRQSRWPGRRRRRTTSGSCSSRCPRGFNGVSQLHQQQHIQPAVIRVNGFHRSVIVIRLSNKHECFLILITKIRLRECSLLSSHCFPLPSAHLAKTVQ